MRGLLSLLLLLGFSNVFSQEIPEGFFEEDELELLEIADSAQSDKQRKVKKPWPTSFGDIFNTDKALMGKNVFSGSVSHSMGRVVYTDPITGQTQRAFRNAFVASFQVRFWKNLMANASLFAYYDRDIVEDVPWLADYFYSLKWFNWKPQTFSYGYENYVDNKFTDSPKRFLDKFLQGYYFVTWNHNLPKKWIDAIRLDVSTNFNITYHARYMAQYRNEVNDIMGLGKGGWGKAVTGLTLRYTIWLRIYLEFSAFYYPYDYNGGEVTQVQWDPDFTYGFGYFDWRPFRFSITYGNYVMNRFPFNEQKVKPEYGILDGDLRVSISWAW